MQQEWNFLHWLVWFGIEWDKETQLPVNIDVKEPQPILTGEESTTGSEFHWGYIVNEGML